MKDIIIEKKDMHLESTWPGGKTTQFAIFPNDAKGATDFDYEFEITSSTMDYEKTDYTIYDNYMRTLMIIRNKTKLSHEDGRSVLLSDYKYDYFDGSCFTFTEGVATDYELMVKKGNYSEIKHLSLDQNDHITEKYPGYKNKNVYYGIYCDAGFINISLGANKYVLSEGDQFSYFIFNEEGIEKAVITGEGECILTTIIF